MYIKFEFPLDWPDERPRSKIRVRSQFSQTFAKCRNDLVNELRLMGAIDIVISSNLPTNSKNEVSNPSGTYSMSDPAITAIFKYRRSSYVFACDKFLDIRGNIKAIANTVNALRGIERWGASDMLERAFLGFKAIETPRIKTCWEILGIHKTNIAQTIKDARYAKAMECHPDHGGTSELFQELTNAYDEAIRFCIG